MKNNTYFSRQHIFRWLLLCWLLVPWALQAQTRITWTSQVGCQEFRGEKEGPNGNGIASSYIDSSQCVRVCELSPVIYTLNGQNISNVQWTVSGGTVSVSGSGNTQATVNWGVAGSGSLQATVTYSNGTVENQSICVEKIHKPIAEFALINLDYSVCKNTTIYFDNLSQQNGGSDIVNYFWEFGDGSTSTAFEPSHSYADSGIYTIKLTVTNKCGCMSSFKKEIEVLKAPPVQINCASVVCEGSVEKYSVQDGCKEGKWKVIGGSIVNNNGNEIEVKWDQVDPADGFGYVMFLSECACPEWTTVKIPVILSKVKIKGQPVICANKQYTYAVPQWPTTEVKWDLSGPSGGQLNYNQQRNEVIFSASQAGTYTLTANYFNTLLSCEGQGSIDIVVEEPVTVVNIGADEICAGENHSFTTTPNVPVIWTVTTGNSVYNSPVTTGTFTYNFAAPGTYTVSATKQNGGCESKPVVIKVSPIPAAPTGSITGEIRVCPGKPYVYSLSWVDPGVIPVWEVANGTIQGSNTGSSVTVVFNSGLVALSVRNKSLGTAGCLSDPKLLKIKEINLNTITLNSNPGPFCPSSLQSFSANLNGIVPDSMEWSLTNSGFGSVVSGQGTANITVNFNEISGTNTSTTLNLKIVKCGVTKILTIPVSLLPLPVISFTNVGNICLGSPLNFTVNQGGITSAPGGVKFTFANGTSYPANFDINGNYSFPNNGYIQNNTGGNISQTVTVTYYGTNGCSYSPTASANFIIFPETIITVSPVYNIAVCDPATMTPYTLTANSSTGLTNTTGWQWYRNNMPIFGATTNVYTISGANAIGVYKVQATDQNGCIVYSQDIKVIQSCPSSSGCTADPQINFTPKWTGCNTISVTNLSYIGTPDEIQWVSDGVLTLSSAQGLPTATYQTTLAGAHIVFVRLRYGTCWYSRGIEVRKNYEPKFNVGIVCNGSGYNVTLYNTSTKFEITAPITYTFSGGGQPNQTGQTATYNNLAPGNYTFTLTVSSPGLPPCTTTQTVTLAPPPSVGFLLPAMACSGEVIDLVAPGYNSANTYTWFYGSNSIVASGGTTQIAIVGAGTVPVKLRVKTPQGCVYESSVANVNILSASFNGNIVPPSVTACVGSAPTVTYVPTGTAPSGYIWMNGSQPVSGAPNSASFVPSQSGYYWPILISSNGCKIETMSTQPVSVTLKNLPYVNISGKANICANSSTILTGITTDNTVEYQWKRNGVVVVAWSPNPSPAPITYNTGSLPAGTYVYTLEVRIPGAGGCVSSKTFTLTVSNPPSGVSISYTMQSCQPYIVKLTASGPSTGDYNWSNGMSGQSITVNEGGAYEVIYTAPSGCKVSSTVEVPLSLESLMWVFPTGCYDNCYRKGYVIGPKGLFNHYEWQLFNSSIQSGNNSFINPLYLGTAGTYQLQISNFGCTFTSGALNYFPGKECGVESDCKIEAKFEPMKWYGDHFALTGAIYNAGSQAITLTLSSTNGSGSYIPSMITIPAGGVYDLNVNPISFYPNANYSGGDELLLTNETCKFVFKVEGSEWGKTIAKSNRALSVTAVSSLKMIPNPAKEKVKVSYNTGNENLQAKQITVFDAMGNVKFRKELKATSGEVDVEISNWLQGVYIVIVQTGDTSLQGKLIKN